MPAKKTFWRYVRTNKWRRKSPSACNLLTGFAMRALCLRSYPAGMTVSQPHFPLYQVRQSRTRGQCEEGLRVPGKVSWVQETFRNDYK